MGKPNFLVICIFWLCSASCSNAQENVDQKVPRERKPAIIFATNEDGEDIAFVETFPWSTYDKLMRAESESQELGAVISAFHFRVTPDQDFVTIAGSLTVRINESGQHKLSIGMGNCHLLSQPVATAPPTGEAFAVFDELNESHDLFVTGSAGDLVEIELQSQLAIQRVGNRNFFRMRLPRVADASMLVTLPDTVSAGVSDSRMTVRKVSTAATKTELEAGRQQFRLDGLTRSFEFWWQPRTEAGRDTNGFAVKGEVDVRVDELGNVTGLATLNLTAFENPLQGCVVQLPPNMRWSKDAIFPFEDEYLASAAEPIDGREAVQIIFTEPAMNPPAIRIAVEAIDSGRVDSQAHALDGFHVIHAATESGTIRVYREGDWHLKFSTDTFSKQTNEAAGTNERTFAYSRLNQITMTVTKQTSQLLIEPIYVVTLDETVARLTAVFRCTRRGARQGDLTIQMGNWIFQSLRPGSENVTIDTETPELLSPNNGRLTIPVKTLVDRFDVELTATLPLENGVPLASEDVDQSNAQIELQFPTAEQGKPQHATVALQTEETLSVNAVATTDYSEIRLPAELQSKVELELKPLCFRMRNVGPPAPLPVQAVRLERETLVDIQTEIVNVTSQRIRLRQTMNWRVRGVPLSYAQLSVSDIIHESCDLRLEVNGKPTTPRPVRKFDNDSGENVITLQVPIEPKELGEFELVATYDWPRWVQREATLDWESMNSVAIDLPMPENSSVIPNFGKLSVYQEFREPPRNSGYMVKLHMGQNANWLWEDLVGRSGFFSEANIDFIPLVFERAETTEITAQPFDELVDRAWFQTWCTETKRTERAVFRIQGGGSQEALVSMPPNATSSLRVWLDGKTVDFRQSDEDTISIDLKPNQSLQVLELFYSRPRNNSRLLETTLPKIADAEFVGQWYWHLILPRDECIVAWPRRLTRAHHWDLNSLFPRRVSEMSTRDLEEWSGALTSSGRVLAGSSDFLFGVMGEPGTITVRTMPLSVYVLLVAGLVLVVGLLIQQFRNPVAVTMVLGIVIFAAICINPAYASLLGQFVILGILLLIFGQILSWLLSPSPRTQFAKVSPNASTWIRKLQEVEPDRATESGELGVTEYRSMS